MFDIATRYTPNTPQFAGLSIPFDWVLSQPRAQAVTLADYHDPCNPITRRAVVLQAYSLMLEDTLQTAVLLSLFTDRRASGDDALPRGETQRRGWVGDATLASIKGLQDRGIGSHLWLLYQGQKSEQKVMDLAQLYAAEALQWMIDADVVARLLVTAQWHGQAQERLALRVQLYKGLDIKPVYDVLWGTSLLRGSSGVHSSVGSRHRDVH